MHFDMKQLSRVATAFVLATIFVRSAEPAGRRGGARRESF